MAQAAEQTDARPALSAEGIVDAATTLIERDGLRAFTMRALGRELGVSAMAVYGYFPSRDDLLAAVLDRFMATMDTDPVLGERWDDTLRRTMTSIYREDLSHPQLSSIEVESLVAGEGLARHTEKIVSLHLAQGMPVPLLSQTWAMVDAYLTGFIDNAIAAAEEKAERDRAAARNGAPDALPLWQRIAADAYTDEAFAHGVEIIIRGVRALAAPDPCEWYTPE